MANLRYSMDVAYNTRPHAIFLMVVIYEEINYDPKNNAGRHGRLFDKCRSSGDD